MIQNLLLGGHILLRRKTIKHLSETLLTSQRYVAFNVSFIVDLISAKINTCQSEHDALVRAAIRSTPGYKVTGVILVICPRHGLIHRNGVGDLQKGERYSTL